MSMKIYSANLAQLVEQLIRNEQVAGSIPAVGSELFNKISSIGDRTSSSLFLNR